MKTLNPCWKKWLPIVLVAGCMMTGTTSQAQIIIDNFDKASSGGLTALSGQTPDTNVPGGAWAVRGSGFTAEINSTNFLGPVYVYGNPSTPVDFALVNGDAATLALAGSNSGVLKLSAYILPRSGGASGLGFSPIATGTVGYSFSGLALDSSGNLLEFVNGSVAGSVAYAGGTFNATSTAYKVSLTVDTSSGALTAISLSGSTADYSSFLGGTSFTTAKTAFLAMDSNISGSYAFLNLSGPVAPPATAPEPSTWALLLGGLGLLAGVQIKRFRRA